MERVLAYTCPGSTTIPMPFSRTQAMSIEDVSGKLRLRRRMTRSSSRSARQSLVKCGQEGQPCCSQAACTKGKFSFQQRRFAEK